MRRMALNSTPRTPMPWKIKLKCHKTLLPTLRCTLLRAHISSEGDDNGQSVAAAPGSACLFILSTLFTDQLFPIRLPLLVHRSSFSFYLSIGILGYVSHIQCVVSQVLCWRGLNHECSCVCRVRRLGHGPDNHQRRPWKEQICNNSLHVLSQLTIYNLHYKIHLSSPIKIRP